MSTVDRSAWTRISVTVEQALATRVEEVLDTLGAVALTRTDAGDTPQFDGPTPDDPQWPHQEVSGLFNADENVEGVIAALQLVVGQGSIETSVIEDEDWELSGRKIFRPCKSVRGSGSVRRGSRRPRSGPSLFGSRLDSRLAQAHTPPRSFA